MEEKKTGKNVSSGAKKVEKIESEKAEEAVKASAPKTRKKASGRSATAKKQTRTTKKPKEKAEKLENAAAEKRLQAAKARKERKEKKLMKRAELKSKKLEKRAELKAKKLEKRAALAEKKANRKQKRADHKAALKERKLEKRAERTARRELLKNESKADRRARQAREKKEKIALRRSRNEAREKARAQRMKSREASRARRAENRRRKREKNAERRKHAPGFGGWLAAVISLGVATLALGSIVTAGAFRMNEMTTEAANGARSTLFEMVSVSEDMDSNLSKLRVSSGAGEQQRILTGLVVDSMLMESALERMPLDTVTGSDISAYINKMGTYSRSLLEKVASGEQLTEKEKQTVEYLHGMNEKVYNELNDMTTHMTQDDFMAFLGGKEGNVSKKLSEIGKSTLEKPEETLDAPFSEEGNVGENKLKSEKEISESRAGELVKEYLKNYHIAETQYTGETVTDSATLYNFMLKDESGSEIFAQITKNGGKLAFFNLYEECEEKNFDLETCDHLAKEFLGELGIGDVEAVWLSDGGMVADLTYVGVQEGVRVYPDLIRVRVCESKGRVVGMDAMGYYENHAERAIGSGLSREEAQGKLSEGLKPYSAHLAIIPVNDEEILTHEFACTYGEDEYLVYLDAETGEEVQVYRVRNSRRGRYLR